MGEKLHSDSWNAHLLSMGIGERTYVECTLTNYKNKQRVLNAPKSRRPGALSNMEFTTQLFTAVSSSKAGDVRYLICLERMK